MLGTSAEAQAPDVAAGSLQMGEIWAAKGADEVNPALRSFLLEHA